MKPQVQIPSSQLLTPNVPPSICHSQFATKPPLTTPVRNSQLVTRHSSTWVLRSRRAVLPDGVRDAAVYIRDGLIADLGDPREIPPGIPCLDAGEDALLPGLIDPHVHINEPGRTHWEGFASATRTAAAGGVTTVIDMPLNNIPATTSAVALEQKRAAAAGSCWVDVGFYGGLVPGNLQDLEPLQRAGVFGFKCFLADSGVPEFPPAGKETIEDALPVLQGFNGLLLAHCELLPSMADVQHQFNALAPAHRRRYQAYLASRPERSEAEAISFLLEQIRKIPVRLHIVHLSSQPGLELAAAARAQGIPTTVETCPHYLFFRAEEIPDGATTFKCAPPIRNAAHQEALWEGLRRGDVDLIASDHSPCPPELKDLETGDFATAWGGIASLQLILPVTWSQACERGFDLADIACWMSGRAAKLLSIDKRKGSIQPGLDADFVVFDPEKSWKVDSSRLLQRHRFTPYAGKTLRGEVKATFLRGNLVYNQGEIVGPARGQTLRS